jgi:DNA helicase-2/ATP-dependent DNA helicase PcrA
MREIPTLTGEAAKAVSHRGSHIQIIASAGSGKTETVSQRIARLIAEGEDPSGIVAFTFTERAAEELKDRIRQRVEVFAGPQAVDCLGNMYVGTIHGFCFRLLTKYVSKFESYDVMDEGQTVAFVQRQANLLKIRELDTGPNSGLFRNVSNFVKSLSVIENELIDLSVVPEPLKSTVERFYQFLDEYRFLSFGRQIFEAVRVLQDEEFHKQICKDIVHLVVDEYQDVNPAQEELIRLISKPFGNAELVVVGDDDQSIYQWRGSTTQNITTFAERYEGVTTFQLLENRRSRPDIVKAANSFAKTINGRIEKEMKHVRKSNGPSLNIIPDHAYEADEAKDIAESIQKLSERGYAFRDMAVLVRGKTAYEKILEAFEYANIPVQPGGRMGLFDQHDADFLGRVTCWLSNREWKEGRFQTTRVTVELHHLETIAKSLYSLNAKEWRRLEDFLIEWKGAVGSDTRDLSLVGKYYEFAGLLKIAEWPDEVMFNARRGTLARFQRLIADYEVIQRRSRLDVNGDGLQVGVADKGTYYYTNLADLMVNYAIGEYDDFEGEDDPNVDAVDLMTIHAAKGLEWPIVFMPSLTAKRFPSFYSGKQQNWLLPRNLFDAGRYEGGDVDERRLFYVGVTRAREWLNLSAHERVNKVPGAVSPYIEEMVDIHEGITDLPKPPSDEFAPVDVDLSLTYSELASFLECGYSYWLRNRLGFPPAIVQEIGYGKAIHHMMRVIAEETQRLERPLKPRDIDRLLAIEFFLPFANKGVAKQFKESARNLIMKYMHEHGEEMNKVWETERPFELSLTGVVISGRADVIIDKSEDENPKLAIVDYKTSVDERNLDLQLQIYTLAGKREGLTISGAYIHDLKDSNRNEINTSVASLEKAAKTVEDAAKKIKERDFQANPELKRCIRCDVKTICKKAKLA